MKKLTKKQIKAAKKCMTDLIKFSFTKHKTFGEWLLTPNGQKLLKEQKHL